MHCGREFELNILEPITVEWLATQTMAISQRRNDMITNYKLNAKGAADVEFFKNTIAQTINKVATMMPEGREKSLFLTNIEQASFFGTKAISSLEGNYTEVVTYPFNNT